MTFRGRLHRKVALVREVEIQPRLGENGKDIPDLLAVALTAGPNRAEVIIEVKCNWNDKLTSGLEDQLGHRYLRGPHGRVGLYVVGFFRGESWVATDGRRRRAAGNIAHVQEELNAAAQRLNRKGVSVDIRVLDLVLDEGLSNLSLTTRHGDGRGENLKAVPIRNESTDTRANPPV